MRRTECIDSFCRHFLYRFFSPVWSRLYIPLSIPRIWIPSCLVWTFTIAPQGFSSLLLLQVILHPTISYLSRIHVWSYSNHSSKPLMSRYSLNSLASNVMSCICWLPAVFKTLPLPFLPCLPAFHTNPRHQNPITLPPSKPQSSYHVSCKFCSTTNLECPLFFLSTLCARHWAKGFGKSSSALVLWHEKWRTKKSYSSFEDLLKYPLWLLLLSCLPRLEFIESPMDLQGFLPTCCLTLTSTWPV